MTARRAIILTALGLVLLSGIGHPAAAERETTWVPTFNREFVNWADPHVKTYAFPPADLYSAVYCRITLGCPVAPGDCDPWDRFANIGAGRQLSAGVYLCELSHGEARATTRLLMVR
jgi:hypothetical protein